MRRVRLDRFGTITSVQIQKSADEKLKSLSRGQGSRATSQATDDPLMERHERQGRRVAVPSDSQTKARHRSRSEGPRRHLSPSRQDTSGPQWAISHEPRKSPHPLCLRQFSEDDIVNINLSDSDTDSGDSGPKRWTRNPLLIKKTKRHDKTKATEWKLITPPPPPPQQQQQQQQENKSQTMPNSINRPHAGIPSPSSGNKQDHQNTWSNPNRVNAAIPQKAKFQRLEEMRQQRMENYPTSDEETNPHSEISNQIRQRLSQVQAGRGKGRKASIGEYEGVTARSGQEYTNYLNISGDQIVLEPKLKTEVSKPAQMTASFPCYRPMSLGFTASGSLSPPLTFKRDNKPPSQPEKPKPRMVVVEYPRKNNQNIGLSNNFNNSLQKENRNGTDSQIINTNFQCENRKAAASNPNRNSTAFAFGNNIQCISPPPPPPPQQQQQQQQQIFQQQTFQQQQPENFINQNRNFETNSSLQNAFLLSNGHNPQLNTRPLSFQPYVPTQPKSPQLPAKVDQHPFQEQKKEKSKAEQKQKNRRSKTGIDSNSKESNIKHTTNYSSKSYSDGDSLDELLESNKQYIEPTSVNNTLQLTQHSNSQNEKPISASEASGLPKVSEPIPMLQPVMPKIPELVTTSKPVLLKMSSEPVLMSQQCTGSKLLPVTPRNKQPITSSQIYTENRQPILRPTPIRISEPVLITQSPVCESSAFQSCMSWLKSHDNAQPAANQNQRDNQPSKPLENAETMTQYKPLITISESILVSESNKIKSSPEVIKKSLSCSAPSIVSSTKANISSKSETPENELALPIKDTGMFSDVEYDIEVAERVKKWETKMKTSLKNPPVDSKTGEIPDIGENHLPTTVKHMASEWSKYLAVIDEDSVATKPYSSDVPTKPVNVNKNMSKSNMTRSLSQTGSISDGDLFKGKTHSKIMVDINKSLLQISPDVNNTTANGLSHSYHEGINKSPTIDSPLFLPVRNFSSNNTGDTLIPASSPLTNKDYQFFIPKHHTAASAPNSGSTTLELKTNEKKTVLYPQDINNTNIPTGNFLRRKSDITSDHSISQMVSNRRNAEHGNWKNLIGGMQEKLKDSEIWSPQMDSHQGPVSIERVTARTLETIPFSEDPFWKEIEELTNFDHLMKESPSERKNSTEIDSTKAFTSCQMDAASTQHMKPFSLPSFPASNADNKPQSKPYSTSSLKSSNKIANMNALDEVLLDLQPVLGNRMSNSQRKIFGSHSDMSHKSSSPKRPLSYHSGSYHGDQLEVHSQMLKAACNSGPSAERPEFSSQQNLLQLQEGNHGNLMYQSMTKLGEKQYENVVNGNYQLDPSVLKEKLINTGLVERSPSGDDLAFLIKNIQEGNNNVMFAFRDNEKPTTYTPAQPEENIEELKVLASQVEDKLSEIKSKILKADESNLDRILNTLKKFSPATSAMLSADVKSSSSKKSNTEHFVNRKAKLSEALNELEKIYTQLNIGNETLLDCNKPSNFSSPYSSQESHCFRLSSSFSQLYDNTTGHVSSDSFHSDMRYLSTSDHGLTTSQRYRELMQVPVKDIGSKYPIKTESQTSNSPSVTESPLIKTEDASGDSVLSTSDVPTRRARTRRQRRSLANEMNQESKKFQSRNSGKEGNDGPSVYLSSITVEKGSRSKSSARSDTSDGSSRLINGTPRPKPPPRSSSLHRKSGRDDERNHRKSTPPDFDMKHTTSSSQSQSSNGNREIQENGNISKQNFQQQLRQEQSCSSDSSAEMVQQKKRPVSKGIAKMLDLFSSSDEDRHRKVRTRSRHERRPISEISEEQGNKFSDDSQSSKSSPKSQSSSKVMTPRNVKQRHEAKARQKIVIAQQMMMQENESPQPLLSDENLATEDSSTASKPPLPIPRQRSQSSEKCLSSSDDNVRDEQGGETPNESSNNEKQREKSSPASSNKSRSRWSISSAREFVNATDSPISFEKVAENEVNDHAERCHSFHELFASFEPDRKRIDKLKQLQKSASEEAAEEENGKMHTFHSEPDLRDSINKGNKRFD
ncbi:uncharacterized protein LOC106879036 isoform X1 [Octopus bimaculoides]|uniref:uncharacterized protein LOC106879036 isoform X1 n=1 Tax=Octopus bimaculoides TaxID=37653 RepID=UPI00071E5572|nr:uncharacterized protein LOC106879036 isoform X1 [Octopus bimaculoides]XP_014783928.1 uncharacterized protein LOC106879036 isoform X1 [Octopus bimaculoides]XP_052823365.1 uncharacterized protein LOC106879036 isoform X1 [Octopus bimaculoides]|eukprot:XP_014783927.1 PREDICTED: uncharacterized protein LOC106879036 isoform X1 [Octopus bimaculoides]